jgi:hypothetical protein
MFYLVSRASGPVARIHIDQIVQETGMSRPTIREARNELVLHLGASNGERKKGIWEFELLAWTVEGCQHLRTSSGSAKFPTRTLRHTMRTG